MRWFRVLFLPALLLWLSPALADKRVALVIGNGAYQHADKLANPVTDARNIRDALGRLGFAVTYGEDLDQREMRRVIGRFADTVDGADVALVYFAGHGASFSDTPYVVPVDAEFSSIGNMPYELVSVETLIGELRRAKGVRIAILDACRDDAAERDLKRVASRGLGAPNGGLVPVKNPEGLIIAYATQYQSTAADGDPNGDSPFTAALLKHIATPDLYVQDMFIRVARDVIKSTEGRQRPEISISMYDAYSLGGSATPDRPAPALAPSTLPSQQPGSAPAKIPDRVTTTEESTPTQRPPAATPAPAESPAIGSTRAAYRAAMLVEAPEEPSKLKTFLGSVTWRQQEDSEDPHATIVVADIRVPDDNMTVEVVFEKNSDSSLPASHKINVRFTVQSGSYTGDVKQINVPQLRDEGSPTGEALAGESVPISRNHFLVGLSPGNVDVANIGKLVGRPWIDIPILLTSGKIAKLTFEKGSEGSSALSALLQGATSSRRD